MKVCFAIMLVLLMATAYGFRVRQGTNSTNDDMCQSYDGEYESDAGSCTYEGEYCNHEQGSKSTSSDSCEDGSTSYSSNFCDSNGTCNYFGEETNSAGENSTCTGTSTYSDDESYNKQYCTYSNGTWDSYESTYSYEDNEYTTTEMWGYEGETFGQETCVGGTNDQGEWDEQCHGDKDHGEESYYGDYEEEQHGNDEADLEESLNQVKVAAYECGCQEDGESDEGKLCYLFD